MAIPHLDTFECLEVAIELWRMQTLRPYLIVVDGGSPPATRARLERLRADDLEIHYVAGHGYRHSSECVTVQLDLAQALCRTKLLFHTHTDVFPRRRDLLETWARMCNVNNPAVGYRMSPRDWITKEWEWMIGHSALMLYMPSIHRAGATWSFQRMHYAFGYPWQKGHGWPDTECGFNHAIRDAGIVPVFLGYDQNNKRMVDDNIDHPRSFTGRKVYAAGDALTVDTFNWMDAAIQEAWQRVCLWGCQDAAG